MTPDPRRSAPSHPVLDRIEARAGVTGHNARYGLAGVVIAVAVIYFAYFG